ncbi:MAG TPA: amidohydrolase, partial [Bacteroidia bacterium]
MKVDLIIENGQVLTMDDARTIIDSGVIVIDKGKILDVGERSILEKYHPEKKINASGKLVMPGLINTHTHTGNTVYRGIADDLALKDWLEKFIFPLEAKFCNKELVTLSAQLSMIEMIKSGTTAFSDMYYFEHEVAVAAKEIGIRAQLAETLLDFPSPTVKNSAEGLRYTEELITNWKNDPLIRIAVAPHAPYTCSSDTIKKAKALADKHNVGFHLHLSETEHEVNESLKKHNATPVEYLNNLGVLHGNVFAVHCVHLSENDREILKRNNIGVSYNAQSNMKLASGVAPVCDLLKRGVLVGTGTDGAASNNTLNMFEEMDMGSKLQKVFTKDATALKAQTAVEMATISAARLLRMQNDCGS